MEGYRVITDGDYLLVVNLSIIGKDERPLMLIDTSHDLLEQHFQCNVGLPSLSSDKSNISVKSPLLVSCFRRILSDIPDGISCIP